MGNENEHLDHALAGEFSGHGDTIHKLKLEADKEIKEKKSEVKEQEDRLLQRENNIDRRDTALQNRETALEERENNLLDKQQKIQEAKEEMEEIKRKEIIRIREKGTRSFLFIVSNGINLARLYGKYFSPAFLRFDIISLSE